MEDIIVSDKKNSFPSARRVITTSFLVDISDIILNLTAAILSGSIVMLMETFEGIADVVASGFLVIGSARSGIPENKQFPFGHGRELYFWAFMSALVIIGITSTLSIYMGFQRFFHPQELKDLQVAYAVLILAIFTNGYALFLSLKRLLGKSHSNNILATFMRSSLIETKTAFVLDFIGTIAAALGFLALLVYKLTGDQRFDGLGAISVGIVLGALGILLIFGIRDLLIGKGASPETLKKIREVSMTIPEVRDVSDVKTMHIGSEKLLVNMDVQMKRGMTTHEIAKLIDDLKEKIKKEIPTIKHLQVELEIP